MTELSGKRIVMTGATGFIGSHVAKRFLEAGAEVYCLVRPVKGAKTQMNNAWFKAVAIVLRQRRVGL